MAGEIISRPSHVCALPGVPDNPRDTQAPCRTVTMQPCHCGKRYIDEVFAHIYVIFREEGIFSGKEPLRAVGQPLIHPGFPMEYIPLSPQTILVLLSPLVTAGVAGRLMCDALEVKGVVRSGPFVPGITDPSLMNPPAEYVLLAGCDVRADIFPPLQVLS